MANVTEIVLQDTLTEVVVLDPLTEIVVDDPRTIVEVPSAEVEIIELGIQGPPGVSGGAVEIDFGALAASTTATIDDVDVLERCVEWLVCAHATSVPKSQVWIVNAVNDGSAASHSVFGKVRQPAAGGPLNITTVVDVSAGRMRLRLTNNELFSIDISVLRMNVSP